MAAAGEDVGHESGRRKCRALRCSLSRQGGRAPRCCMSSPRHGAMSGGMVMVSGIYVGGEGAGGRKSGMASSREQRKNIALPGFGSILLAPSIKLCIYLL